MRHGPEWIPREMANLVRLANKTGQSVFVVKQICAGATESRADPGASWPSARRTRGERRRRGALDIVKPSGIVNHVVLDTSPKLDRVFRALAHPARRAIVRQLSGGERNLSELAAPLKMTFPAATKHVRVLEAAKLVRRRVAGREHRCSLCAGPLKEATLWTEQFRRNWEARYEALDSLLDELKQEESLTESKKSKKQERKR